MLLDLLHFLSSDESDSFNEEFANDGSEFGSSGTCAFPFCFDDYVGPVSGVGYGIFYPIGVESNCDVVTLVLLVPIGVESKGGQLIKIFLRAKP